jgi:hypothetical protein
MNLREFRWNMTNRWEFTWIYVNLDEIILVYYLESILIVRIYFEFIRIYVRVFSEIRARLEQVRGLYIQIRPKSMYPFSAAYKISDSSPTRTCPNHVGPHPRYILSRIPIGTRHVWWKGPRYPHIPPGVEWCRSAMCGLDPKAWTVTPKLFRNMGAFAC